MQTKNAQMKFDVIIVGAGLSGLLLARKAKLAGKLVALVEAQDTYGGFHHPSFSSQLFHDSSLHFIAGGIENLSLLNQTIDHFQISLEYQEKESQVLTYEDGEITQFTGFGKLTPKFFEELCPFLSPSEIALNASWSSIAKQIAVDLGDSLYLQHLASELVIEDKVAIGIVVNGSHFWRSDTVIFSGGLTELQAFLPQGLMSSRLKNHLKRPKLWTIVAVDFRHRIELTANPNLHILNGTTQDDIGPCVGRFLAASDGLQTSQWLSFTSDEDADESENIGSLIKKIKRQIKRAYPAAFEGSVSEKIVVIPSGAGHFEDSQVINGVVFKDLTGFYLNSSLLSSQKGVLKPLDQALKVAKTLGWISQDANPTDLNAQITI